MEHIWAKFRELVVKSGFYGVLNQSIVSLSLSFHKGNCNLILFYMMSSYRKFFVSSSSPPSPPKSLIFRHFYRVSQVELRS